MAYKRMNTQDGVTVMNKKLYDNLQDGIEERGVTPEMFGAVGDGVTDDTLAIQECINYASTNHKFVIMTGNYLTNDTIVITGNYLDIYAEISSIRCNSGSPAILITKCSNSVIKLGEIQSTKGDGIEFRSTDNSSYCQYVNLFFKSIKSLEKCIYFNTTGGWTNEIRIHQGALNKGKFGIYADALNHNAINGIKVYSVGIEGVTTGFYLANGVANWFISSCRYAENFETLIETVGIVRQIIFIGQDLFYPKQLKLSKDTTGSVVAPLTEDGGAVVDNYGRFVKGLVFPLNYRGYANVRTNTIYDLNKQTNYIFNIPNYFLVGSSSEIILSPLYGDKGIKEFYVRCLFDNNSQFSIKNSNGEIIFNNTADIGWSSLRFEWFDAIGWVVSKLSNISKMVNV